MNRKSLLTACKISSAVCHSSDDTMLVLFDRHPSEMYNIYTYVRTCLGLCYGTYLCAHASNIQG